MLPPSDRKMSRSWCFARHTTLAAVLLVVSGLRTATSCSVTQDGKEVLTVTTYVNNTSPENTLIITLQSTDVTAIKAPNNFIETTFNSTTKEITLETNKAFETYEVTGKASTIQFVISCACADSTSISVQVNVELKLNNKYAPVFIADTMTGLTSLQTNVSVPLAKGFTIIGGCERVLQAIDYGLDSSTITFSVEDSHNFAVTSSLTTISGKEGYEVTVKTANVLSFDAPQVVTLTATDGGSPPKSTELKLTLTPDAVDSTPPDPWFSEAVYTGEITEETSSGDTITFKREIIISEGYDSNVTVFLDSADSSDDISSMFTANHAKEIVQIKLTKKPTEEFLKKPFIALVLKAKREKALKEGRTVLLLSLPGSKPATTTTSTTITTTSCPTTVTETTTHFDCSTCPTSTSTTQSSTACFTDCSQCTTLTSRWTTTINTPKGSSSNTGSLGPTQATTSGLPTTQIPDCSLCTTVTTGSSVTSSNSTSCHTDCTQCPTVTTDCPVTSSNTITSCPTTCPPCPTTSSSSVSFPTGCPKCPETTTACPTTSTNISTPSPIECSQCPASECSSTFSSTAVTDSNCSHCPIVPTSCPETSSSTVTVSPVDCSKCPMLTTDCPITSSGSSTHNTTNCSECPTPDCPVSVTECPSTVSGTATCPPCPTTVSSTASCPTFPPTVNGTATCPPCPPTVSGTTTCLPCPTTVSSTSSCPTFPPTVNGTATCPPCPPTVSCTETYPSPPTTVNGTATSTPSPPTVSGTSTSSLSPPTGSGTSTSSLSSPTGSGTSTSPLSPPTGSDTTPCEPDCSKCLTSSSKWTTPSSASSKASQSTESTTESSTATATPQMVKFNESLYQFPGQWPCSGNSVDLGVVAATVIDGDGKPTYSLEDAPDSVKVDKDSGALSLEHPLVPKNYVFKVVAEWKNSKDKATVIVAVPNVDSCRTNSTKLRYFFVITDFDEEGAYNVSDSQQLNKNCTWTKTSEEPPNKNFFLVSSDGTISTDGIDREDEVFAGRDLAEVLLQVKVTCSGEEDQDEIPEDTADPSKAWYPLKSLRSSTKEVTYLAVVNDINDNKPQFSSSSLVVGYPDQQLARQLLPQSLVTVHATDKDSGLNAYIRYEIVDDNSEGRNQFVIHPHSGTVYPSESSFAFKDTSFNIVAKDLDGAQGCLQSDYLTVQVHILSSEHVTVLTVEGRLVEDTDSLLDQIRASSGVEVKALSSAVVPSAAVSTRSWFSLQLFADTTPASLLRLVAYALNTTDHMPVPFSSVKQKLVDANLGFKWELSQLPDVTDHNTAGADKSNNTGLVAAVATLGVLLGLALLAVAGLVYFFHFRRKRGTSEGSYDNIIHADSSESPSYNEPPVSAYESNIMVAYNEQLNKYDQQQRSTFEQEDDDYHHDDDEVAAPKKSVVFSPDVTHIDQESGTDAVRL